MHAGIGAVLDGVAARRTGKRWDDGKGRGRALARHRLDGRG